MGDRSGYHLPIHPRRRLKMEMFLSRPLRAAVAFLAVVACVSSAYSQERRGGERREIQPEPFPTHHWVFGPPFNPHHYHPPFWYSVPVPPRGPSPLPLFRHPSF